MFIGSMAKIQTSESAIACLAVPSHLCKLPFNFHLQVFLRKKSDHSKAESLKQDGFLMSVSTHVIFLMTKTLPISSSLFEVLVFGALWLQKKFVIVMFNNSCSQLRPAFKVLLGMVIKRADWLSWFTCQHFLLLYEDLLSAG